VVDASVAVKWFLPEEHSDAADRLLNSGLELLSPDLIWAEIGNVLWKRWRRDEISAVAVKSIFQDLRRLPVHLHSSTELADVAWEIAQTWERSFYDSLYLALSAALDCPLVTADLRLCNALGGSSSGRKLIWVADIP
jgi:predicted nucleic acid-binding protein